MRNIQRVVWAKGMLLTPQHFQAHANYVDDSLQFRFKSAAFANWGVSAIELNEEAIENGQLSVTKLRGLFPDGTPMDCPSVDKEPEIRSFVFPTEADNLDVFVGIPPRVEGHNVDLSKSDLSMPIRYTAHVSEVPDENGIDQKKTVQFAHRNISILFGEREAKTFERIRIAQIVRGANGKKKYELSPTYIPPLLDVAASPKLKDLVEPLIEILSAKSQTLSNARRQRGKAVADFNASETSNFWLLHTVNSFLPELSHSWNVRRGHPEPLYVALLRLAGALCSFSLEKDVLTLPPYDHDNLGKSFHALSDAILDLLETVLPSNCDPIPLKQNQRLWIGRITEDEWVKSGKLFLSIAAGGGQEDVIRRTPQLVKVADQDQVDVLIKHALPGLSLRHEPQPPTSIPFRLENQYFSLNQAGKLWDGIVKNRTICFYVPQDLPNAKLELFAVKGPKT